jgi:hypothetical protein
MMKNLYHYGHVGVVSTSDFVRSRVLSTQLIIKIRMRGEHLYREISLARDRRTIAAFRESVAETFDLRRGDENLENVSFTMVKNGEVLIDRDADIQRLVSGDAIEIDAAI